MTACKNYTYEQTESPRCQRCGHAKNEHWRTLDASVAEANKVHAAGHKRVGLVESNSLPLAERCLTYEACRVNSDAHLLGDLVADYLSRYQKP